MAKIMPGRRSIFRNKKHRVQGLITADAYQELQRLRERLAGLAHRQPEDISDADGIEFAIRGDRDTSAYLKEQRRRGW